MAYLIIFGLTLLCCLIFEWTSLTEVVHKLIGSYKLQLQTMQDKELSDEQKQQVLLKQVGVQIGSLLKLILLIVLFISPFIAYVLLEDQSPLLDSELLYGWIGIGVSFLAVFAYILIKKIYGQLFKK